MLQSRAVVLDAPSGAVLPKSGDTDADAILGGRVDASIVYCSGRDRYARLLPDATPVQFPPGLQTGPEHGLAVLKDAHRVALLLALTILSPEGQKIMAQRGFRPATLPSEQAQRSGLCLPPCGSPCVGCRRGIVGLLD